MINNSPPNTTRRIGKSQGFLGLSVADQIYEDGTRTMLTSWQPTPSELKALNEGAPIHVELFGVQHPPIIVKVGEIPKV